MALLKQAAASLALSVTQQTPPIHLSHRFLASLPSADVESLNFQIPSIQSSHQSAGQGSRRINTRTWALSMAAEIVICLFRVSLIMHFRISSRVDQLTEENSTVTAQLVQTTAKTQQLARQNSVLSQRLDHTEIHDAELVSTMGQKMASYLGVHADTQPLILEPPSESGSSEGVLLISN